MSEKEYDYIFKVILLGDRSVGKVSLLFRYVNDYIYEEPYFPTLGYDFVSKIK